MNPIKAIVLTSLLNSLILVNAAHAEVIASTTFDGRTASGNTATDLNWTTNGVVDPGDISAIRFEEGPINLFDSNEFVQNIFIPGINTGNGNTSWTTDISLTVAAGSSVILTDVTFNSVSVSGAQAENVNRRNDYSVIIFDPSSNQVATTEVADTSAGTGAGQPLVTLDFADVELTAPGTYTLQIRGGDFLGDNETGNHTGLDNLSINGTVGGGGAGLAITNIGLDPTTDSLTLTWNSIPGQNYVIRSSFDLIDWTRQLGDPVPASAGETSEFTFDLGTLPEGTPASIFFRVEIQE